MKDIAADLARDLEKRIEKDDQARRLELDRLENVYGLDPDNFETRLTALCRTPESERQVREEISREYRLRHPTLLPYEFLAHLLHHRYLDMIISFNFDELLDQSIEDELGADEYTRVVTEGDFDPTRGVEGPLYIKMHGSATEPDSLRFTRERYYWTPRSIIKLVEDKFDVDNLVVMNLGFTMDSFDFQYVLRKPANLELYHLDPTRLEAEVVDGITWQREKARERRETDRPAALDKPARIAQVEKSDPKPGADFLENLLEGLMERLEGRCEKPSSGPAEWRSVLRHRAVVKVVDGSDLHKPARHKRYLRRRAILEIAFTAAKGRGVVSIGSMVNDRCGRYYDLYKQLAGADADSWPCLCEAGGLVESETYPDTYEVLKTVRQKESGTGTDTPNIHQFYLADPVKLARHVATSLGIRKKENKQLVTLLTETLKNLQLDTEIEIHSCDDRVCSKLFTTPTQLKTLTALKGWTRSLLETEPEFDELWLVAETGQWIAQDAIRTILTRRCSEIHLLQAFDADVAIPRVEIKTHQLPWGRHNRHMTVLRSEGQTKAAIYFVRRLRSTTVSPVYLSKAQADLRRVTRAFEKLWELAERYKREGDPEGQDGHPVMGDSTVGASSSNAGVANPVTVR